MPLSPIRAAIAVFHKKDAKNIQGNAMTLLTLVKAADAEICKMEMRLKALQEKPEDKDEEIRSENQPFFRMDDRTLEPQKDPMSLCQWHFEPSPPVGPPVDHRDSNMPPPHSLRCGTRLKIELLTDEAKTSFDSFTSARESQARRSLREISPEKDKSTSGEFFSATWKLHDAIRQRDIRAFQIALRQGGAWDSNCLGASPLHKTASQGLLEMTTLLLRHRANVNMPDSFGQTALQLAALHAQSQVLKLLLKHRANSTCMDRQGFSALGCAVSRMQTPQEFDHKKMALVLELLSKEQNSKYKLLKISLGSAESSRKPAPPCEGQLGSTAADSSTCFLESLTKGDNLKGFLEDTASTVASDDPDDSVSSTPTLPGAAPSKAPAPLQYLFRQSNRQSNRSQPFE